MRRRDVLALRRVLRDDEIELARCVAERVAESLELRFRVFAVDLDQEHRARAV